MSRNRFAPFFSLNRLLVLSLVAAAIQLGCPIEMDAEEAKATTASSENAPLHDIDNTKNPWEVVEGRVADYKSYVDDCSKKLIENPNHIELLTARSSSNLHIGNPNQVIDDANRILSLKPKEAHHTSTAYCNRGEARLQLKEYKAALDDLNKALEVNPKGDNGEVYFFRGMAHERLGNLDLAKKDYDRAVDEGFCPNIEAKLAPYMLDLQRKIKASWIPPAANDAKNFTVMFKVNREGQVSDLKVSSSSSVPQLDEAGLQAVRRAQPFGKVPKGAPTELDVNYTFEVKVRSHK